MTREEMQKRLETLETRSFYLAMKDHWDRKDFELDTKMFNEMLELKKALGLIEQDRKPLKLI